MQDNVMHRPARPSECSDLSLDSKFSPPHSVGEVGRLLCPHSFLEQVRIWVRSRVWFEPQNCSTSFLVRGASEISMPEAQHIFNLRPSGLSPFESDFVPSSASNFTMVCLMEGVSDICSSVVKFLRYAPCRIATTVNRLSQTKKDLHI